MNPGLATSAEQHDHEQLEFRFDYALGSDPGDYTYRMDAYLFVPRNVGVNRNNYSKGEFYSDVTPYMRCASGCRRSAKSSRTTDTAAADRDEPLSSSPST